jgi:hypothetical protein
MLPVCGESYREYILVSLFIIISIVVDIGIFISGFTTLNNYITTESSLKYI